MAWKIKEIVDTISNKLKARGVFDESLAPHIAYHVAVLQALERRYGDKYPVGIFRGMGGSAVVLKLESDQQGGVGNEGSHKCLKYPLPMIDQVSFSLASVLDNEANKLKDLHHQYIIPLDEVGRLALTNSEVAERNRNVPFYLMPYVESIDLLEYLEDSKASIDTLLRLLHQISLAVRYIHQAGFIHLDIKPQNIFIQNPFDSTANALLADFGFCKKINIGSHVGTLVIGTEEYIHPELLSLMKNRTRTEHLRTRDTVERRFLEQRFDRYSFGMTIANSLITFLKTSNVDTSGRSIPTRILRGLQFIALRCSDGHPQEMRTTDDRAIVLPDSLFRSEIASPFKYTDTDELCRNLSVLAYGLGGYELEEEISDTSSHSICLPPRTFAPLSSRVEAALDSTPIRRLANIAQLALCYHVFPGAAHTRKEHVVGTYQAAAHLLRHLLLDARNPLCALLLTRKHQRLILLSSLLHDISHVPLMHEFEDAVPELDQERYACEILDGKWGGVAFQKELSKIIKLWGIKREDLQVVMGKKEYCAGPKMKKDGSDGEVRKAAWSAIWELPDYELVRSFIDGGIDADKIDYLQRDALHSGVQFGSGVDVERLERTSTTALWVEGGKTKWTARCRFAAWEKGQAAAEGVIGVRYSMYAQVYAHKTVRAARAMLNFVVWNWRLSKPYNELDDLAIADRLFAFASRLKPTNEQPESLREEPNVENFEPTLKDNLPYPEARVIRWMAHVSKDGRAIKLGEAIINRHLYKEVCVLGESQARKFLDIAFPLIPSTRIRTGTVFRAAEWVRLIAFLSMNAREFLNGNTKKIGGALPIVELEQTPEVLIDISLPKTMRTQKALVIVSDAIGHGISWRRLQHFPKESSGAILGLSVDTSPVYEIYGGSGADEFLSKVVVRLFARPDLVANLRVHLNPGLIAQWLNAYRREG